MNTNVILLKITTVIKKINLHTYYNIIKMLLKNEL